MNKTIISRIVFAFLLIVLVLYLGISGITDLIHPDGYVEIDIDAAGYGLVVENSIDGIIHTGKDYYYLGGKLS